MATTITFDLSNEDERKSIFENPIRNQAKVFKLFPKSLIQSIEADRQQYQRTSISNSTSDFIIVTTPSIDSIDHDDGGNYDENSLLNDKSSTQLSMTISSQARTRSLRISRRQRSPSEIRLNLQSNENFDVHEDLTNSQLNVSKSNYNNKLRSSDPLLLEGKRYKQNRVDYVRRAFLEHRFGRRMLSAYSSSATLRSLNRHRSAQSLSARNRRSPYRLPPNSKWHIVRNRLYDIAMMNESYARMKVLEKDLRWTQLGERIRAQVLDMREMSLLRLQEDGVKLKKSHKTKFDLKAIPINELIHVERDGRIYSMPTRDLVLGRLLANETVDLDAFVQLDARRLFQVQQHLLKQQEGRTRLKKNIAFSFCLCNLSFIIFMFITMLIFAMKTIFELR